MATPWSRNICAGTASPGLASGAPAVALIRPEDVSVDGPEGISAMVEERVYLGELVALRLRLADPVELWCRRLGRGAPPMSARLHASWKPEHVRILHP